MKKVLFTLLVLVGMMSEANAQVGYTISLIEQGYDDYNYTKSIALTALNPGVTETEDVYAGIVGGECPPINPGATVTLTIGVAKGWFVHEVKAYTSIETDQMQSPRRSSDVSLLTQIPVTQGGDNTWTFTMPEANVQLYIKYLNTPPFFVDVENTKLAVLENTPKEIAGQIKAQDDQGDAFAYEILGGTGKDLFDIGLKTGIVTMKAGVEPFDYEAWKDAGGVGYTLEVGVCDTRAAQFDEVFGTSHTFTVTISDVNEKPYFTNETDVIYIAEGAATSTDVVTYADIDKYATGEFVNNELAIISDESNLFEISADGHIKTKEGVVLDYETQKDKVYTIEVRVRDANKDTDGQYVYPDFYEDKTFKVKVSDVNEAPAFKAEAYAYELLATERTEQVLGTVETTDPDIYATDFSTITYSLEGDDAANFKIDATTGKISLKDGAAFDYAVKPELSFYAVASDNKNKVSVPVTVTLSRKALTITAQSHAFTYTGAAQTWAQYDVEGLVGDDALTAVVTGSITLPTESPVVNKIQSYEFTKGTAGNYTVTTVDGELTMTAASVAITLTAASGEWTYDGTAHSNTAVTITSGELLAGDVLIAEASGAATNVADTKTGNNPIAEGYKVMHGETDVTANYAITTVAGTLTINPKAVTITAQSHAFIYNGKAQTWPKYDVEGLVGDDAITAVVTGSVTYYVNEVVANKIESYEFTKGTASNYTVTTKDGNLIISKASVHITGGITVSKEVNNGEATYTVDCSNAEFDGLVGDDKITVSGIKVMAVETNEDGSETVTLDFTDMKGEGDHVDCYYIIAYHDAEQVTVAKTTETTAEVAADGTKTETTVSKEKTDDGGTTEVTVETTKEASGKEVVTETKTETDADGNIVASTENKTEKNTDGSTTETSKTYATSGGSTGGGGGGGSSSSGGSSYGGGGSGSVTTESKTTKNANGEVTSSTTSREEKDADGKLIASESSNYEKHDDGSKTESENKMWLDEEACKHETGSLKETDQGAAVPWHESESETLYDQFGMFTEEKTNESWKDLEDGTVFELEQRGCVEEITGNWKEHNIGILWDGDGDPWCKQESTLVKDEHDGTVLSRLDTEEWKDKETGNTILMDSKMPELTGSGEDYVALEWTDEDEANFNAWLKEGSIPDGSDDASLSQFESTWNENAADNFNADLALRDGDQQNVDLCVTAVKNAQDATISKNSSINVRQSENTTKLVMPNAFNGSAKVKTLTIKSEIQKGAFREMAQVKRITLSPKTAKIYVPNRLLKKVVKKHSPSRAPEEESGDVPEGYIEIESGEEYEVLTDEPIVLTIDTEGEPLEITSIKVTQDDISTAIRTIDTASGKTTDEWYTIDGRKLDKAPTAKGIYIVNGKKVAVK